MKMECKAPYDHKCDQDCKYCDFSKPAPIQSPPVEGELLPCPFCAIRMEQVKRYDRPGNLADMVYHPGGKSCILGGMFFDLKKWNARQKG